MTPLPNPPPQGGRESAELAEQFAQFTTDKIRAHARRAAGRCWRLVEAQNRISTAKLTDNAQEQRLLEELIEGSKPPIPPECAHLHFLLFTPFRHGAPYPRGSRFRRAGQAPGVFYASENVETAVAEMSFHRLLFFSESPDTPWPSNASEFTAFASDYATAHAVDLTRAPFDDPPGRWMHPTRYEECQSLAEDARTAGIEAIRYHSARDPRRRLNVALLNCKAFASAQPAEYQTWRILLGKNGVRALCEMPRQMLDFDRAAFADDPRIAAMKWER